MGAATFYVPCPSCPFYFLDFQFQRGSRPSCLGPGFDNKTGFPLSCHWCILTHITHFYLWFELLSLEQLLPILYGLRSLNCWLLQVLQTPIKTLLPQIVLPPMLNLKLHLATLCYALRFNNIHSSYNFMENSNHHILCCYLMISLPLLLSIGQVPVTLKLHEKEI